MSAVLCFFICVKLMISSIYFLSCGFIPFYCFTIVVFLLISVSDSLQPHGLQHKRLPVLHHLPEFAQTHVHWVSDAIQPSHPLSSPSPPPLNLSQHQGLFQCVSSSHQVAWYWSFSFSIGPSNEYSALISFRVHWFDLLAVQETLKSLLQQSQFKTINSLVLSLLYSPTLTSIHDYWRNHSFNYTDLCWQSDALLFNVLSRFVIAFLPRTKCLLMLWLQSLSAVILEPKEIKSVPVSTFSPST